MNKSGLEALTAYEILKEKRIEEMDSLGVILSHRKTKAKLFLMINQDDNKVFNIGFRTPPANNTGLQHILEHSVLCGSESFPAKDPFVELVKGSLNTFLNAMTYPDKTVYPAASCNEKDFQNLMHVYMDAVFHPNIHHEPKIFMQEGWHYELDNADAPLTINGVVYNEMKGAFSSPESVLDRVTRQTLFPDTAYACESGGDPEEIPDLTYEEFCAYHRDYYHPSNSYIYLYGNMDMAEKLSWLDEEYLSRYEYHPVDSAIAMQRPFAKPVEKTIYYSVTEEESQDNSTYLSLSTVVGTNLDPKLYVAFQILEYTLLDAPGAVLKQALLDAGIGEDILGGYESGILQPYFSIIAKNTEADRKGEFLAVIKGTLRRLAEKGIDKKSLLAGLNYYEFRYREADYGAAPKGLMYGLWCMDSWLYDADPLMHLEYQKTFDFLKEAVDRGYFEDLLKEYLLDRDFEAVITLLPQKNLTADKERALAAKLEAYKQTLSQAELAELAARTKALKEYQTEPSAPEDLLKIPMLARTDIARTIEPGAGRIKTEQGIEVLHTSMFTAGIGYLTVLFDTSGITTADLPYASLLKSILGYVDTEKFSYADLSSEIYLNSGGIDFSITNYTRFDRPEEIKGAFVANIKVLYDKIDFAFDLLAEIFTASKLDDEKRLGEILAETKSRSRAKLEGGAHGAAVSRASAYYSPSSAFGDLTGGIAYYHFLEKITGEYENPDNRPALIEKLKAVAGRLFVKAQAMVGYTADEKGYQQMTREMPRLFDRLPAGGGQVYPFVYEKGNKNEGFKTASQVNYVARCGSFREQGPYTGVLKILKVILNYDYLWKTLRVQGGAYGCMSGFGRNGDSYLVSYRDPNVKETNCIYEGIPAYLKAFDAGERDMTKYVIGTISALDTPLPPSIKGARALSAYLSGITDEMMQKEREQVLDAAPEDIRALAPLVEAVLATGSICVIGNEEKIKRDSAMFNTIDNLFH